MDIHERPSMTITLSTGLVHEWCEGYSYKENYSARNGAKLFPIILGMGSCESIAVKQVSTMRGSSAISHFPSQI